MSYTLIIIEIHLKQSVTLRLFEVMPKLRVVKGKIIIIVILSGIWQSFKQGHSLLS